MQCLGGMYYTSVINSEICCINSLTGDMQVSLQGEEVSIIILENL